MLVRSKKSPRIHLRKFLSLVANCIEISVFVLIDSASLKLLELFFAEAQFYLFHSVAATVT